MADNNTYTEVLNTAILTRLSYYHLNIMVELYRRLGSATAIVEQRRELPKMFPGMPHRVVEALNDIETMRERAEEELDYCARHDVKALCLNDADYPHRLQEVPDAPLMLFYKGTADLNSRHVVCIVGTRHCTPYGKDLIGQLVADLARQCPDVLVVSGLAYGVDICAHRECLTKGIDTVGVLAHGIDDLYPAMHRDTANKMVHQGGLLTEFMTHTRADKLNFVRRNRVVAGASDACVLVESAAKGGGLITTRLAREYNRDVFAFPGAVGATYSEGCNLLIRDNGAMLITSADDLLKAMGWETDTKQKQKGNDAVQRELFPNLTAEERRVVDVLRKNNDLQLNMLATQAALPVGQTSSLLFSLEMKGVVKPYAGGTYHLLA